VHRDVERLKRALGETKPENAFIGAITPGQIAFNYPDQYCGSHEAYLSALADALSYEYKAITDAGFNLQIDSPDMAMAAHCRSVGSSVGDWHSHLPLAVDALNSALDGIPAERVRLHVCWGNYAGPHHKDVPLEEIIGAVLNVDAGTIYVEGANPRHAHEWRVFEQVELPDEKSVILGVIDVKSNSVEHPRLVADRLVRLGKIIGKERLIAGTDCGFDTFIRFSLVDPGVAWLKAALAGRRRRAGVGRALNVRSAFLVADGDERLRLRGDDRDQVPQRDVGVHQMQPPLRSGRRRRRLRAVPRGDLEHVCPVRVLAARRVGPW
jgi:5-methyltetrahydropteroyltriglutamate--homocysteine methyltransferase